MRSQEIFSFGLKKMKTEMEATGPRYRWDQIHEMIKVRRQPGPSSRRALEPSAGGSRPG